MAAAVTLNIHPTDAPPFTLAAPLGALPVGWAPPDPPLPPPAPFADPPLPPPPPAAFAPTVKMGMVLPVNEVSNSPAPITQIAPPLLSMSRFLGSRPRAIRCPKLVLDRSLG
ncbi:hypothetical protein B0H11DRAFT_1915505 [Mycena galericulata]|nr:hypothetical protein B0H11DRAFT_1915505 [Mycena galericulata]